MSTDPLDLELAGVIAAPPRPELRLHQRPRFVRPAEAFGLDPPEPPPIQLSSSQVRALAQLVGIVIDGIEVNTACVKAMLTILDQQ